MPEPSSSLDWMALLREHAAAKSISAVARELGYSPSVVSQTLSGTYPGRIENVARRVVEVYGGQTVDCPVLGDLELARCAEHRVRPFAATNPLRVALFRACQSCPFNPSRKP